MDKTLQYRQIDFLRLFRLCKNMGLVKRKRKMPNEYESSYQISAGKRLIRKLIKELFPNYDIKSNSICYYITIPKDISKLLLVLRSRPRSYFDNAGKEGKEAMRRFDIIRQNLNGFVYPDLPYEIKVSVISSDNNSRYNVLREYGIMTRRPRETFYNCAKSCVEYKRIWDENIQYLSEFFNVEEGRQKEREVEALRLKQERKCAERLRLEQEKTNQDIVYNKKNEELKRLEGQIEKEKQSKLQGAQGLFNSALEIYKDNKCVS